MNTHDWKHCPKCGRTHLGPHTCERPRAELERENARLRKALTRELSENRKLAGVEIERHHLTAFMCAQERRLEDVLLPNAQSEPCVCLAHNVPDRREEKHDV